MKQGLHIDDNGNKEWFLDDKLHRIDGPAAELSSGAKHWLVYGRRHRVNGPAVEWSSGDKYWYVNGLRHRIDGPAREFASGDKEWWINHIDVTEEVTEWLNENQYTWPFDESTQLLFQLRFT